ncbi:hypothetical protein O5541_03465 [Escherichia coli]|nr:hypothetical protein [Escherichia coli]
MKLKAGTSSISVVIFTSQQIDQRAITVKIMALDTFVTGDDHQVQGEEHVRYGRARLKRAGQRLQPVRW